MIKSSFSMYSTISQICNFGVKNILCHSGNTLNAYRDFALVISKNFSCIHLKGQNLPQLNASTNVLLLSTPCQPSTSIIPNRKTSFYSRVTAEQLWKGVTSVSNAGRKRGRGTGSKRIRVRDLNRGVSLGSGQKNMLWPGLNTGIIQGPRVVERQELPVDPEKMNKIYQIRDKMGSFKPVKFNPLERGWSGTKLGGKKIGPPDSYAGETFKGFETIVLEAKTVTNMDGNLGRKRRTSIFVVTGNGKGSAGFALGKSLLVRDSMRKAKNKAAKHLVSINRCDGHTVFHDFFCQYHKVKIFVKRKPPGYGLVCHRGIKAICEVIGIKDLHAKVEGSKNPKNITKAFFLGLLQQKTHQQLAENKALHVVKLTPGDCPKVVASPRKSKVRSRDEIPYDEELDYTIHCMDGRIEKERENFEPFYQRLPSYERFLMKQVKKRNHPTIQHQLRYHNDGVVASFFTKDHPECVEWVKPKRETAEEEQEEEY